MQTIGTESIMRGRDAGDEIRGARTRCRDRDADSAAGARVAVGHVRGALFVPHQHVTDRVIEHGVVGGENRAARIPEDRVHAFMDEAFPDDLRAGAFVGMGTSVHWALLSVKLIVVRTR